VVKAKAEISVKQAERAQEDQRRTDCEKAIQTLRDDDAAPNEWNDPSKPSLLPEQRAERINELNAQMEEHRVNVATLDQEIGELRGSYLTKADEAAWKQEKLDKEAQRSQEQQRAADCSQHLDNLYRGASNEWDDPAMPPLANAEVRADRIQQVRGQLDVHNANVNRLDEDIAGLDRRLANPVKDEEEEDDTPAGLQKQIDENEEAFDKQRANLQGNMQTVGKMQQDDEKEANFYNMAVQQIVPLAQAAGQLGSGIGSMVAAPDKRDAAESTALSNFDSSQMGIENSTASIYMDAVGNARDTFKSIGEALGNMQQSNQQLGMDLARNMGA
jgi:hypothetical protein